VTPPAIADKGPRSPSFDNDQVLHQIMLARCATIGGNTCNALTCQDYNIRMLCR
jgi:hypothetical protein